MDTSTGDLDLVKNLVHKFKNRPPCFHLELLPGVSLPIDVLYWIVRHAAGLELPTRLDGLRPGTDENVRLTYCRCDLSGGKESRDPGHVAYQEGCLTVVKAYVALFEELFQSGVEFQSSKVAEDGMVWLFLNLTQSALLTHCRLDTEVLSICRTFLGVAKDCLMMPISSHNRQSGTRNMFKWFEVSFFGTNSAFMILYRN